MSLLELWAQPRKKCNVCRQLLTLDSFFSAKKGLYGKRAICKACQFVLSKPHRDKIEVKARNKALRQIWYKNPKSRESIRERQRVDWLYNRAACLVRDARNRATQKKVPFGLGEKETDNIQKIIDIGRCQMTDVPFDMVNSRTARSPSLDRIIPALGYVEGNVRVVCTAMNLAMNSWGEEELWNIVQAWAAKRETK